MLLRLTDDEADTQSPAEALAQKFSDVATLFGALDPRVARVMFSRLATAVLELNPERRQMLLRRTILPGLLDGRVEGEVLKDFPDLDLADSLCLLLDLETAAPEVVTGALARLDLQPERHNAMLPLIRERCRRAPAPRERRASTPTPGSSSHSTAPVEELRRVRGLRSRARRAGGRHADPDPPGHRHNGRAQRSARMPVEPGPAGGQPRGRSAVHAARAPDHGQLDTEGRWPYFAFWLSRFSELAAALRETRPDVSDVIAASSRVQHAGLAPADCRAGRSQGAEGRAAADTIILALGAGIGPALAAAASAPGGRA